MDDPHPFYRDKIGRTWTFQHNGGVDKTRMTNLINAADSTYLTNNPPNGSGIPACETGVVDSELYFLFLLLKIEQNGWDVNNGIVEAVNTIIAGNENGGLNFILSDGFRLWVFRRGQLSTHTLYYIYDAAQGYAAAASQYPSSSQGHWIAMDDYQLVMLTATDAPVVFDVTDYAGELLVDNDFNSSVSSADLRANSEGQDWYESRELTPALLTWETKVVGENSTPKAKLSAASQTADENAYLTQEFSVPQSDIFWAEADIYVDSISNLSGEPDRAAFMLIGDNSEPTRTGPNSDDPERFVYLAFYKNGGGGTGTMDLVARDRDDQWDGFTTIASGLNLDQWYQVRVVCDIPSGTYDVYVDRVFQATVTSRNEKTVVTHISFGEWGDGSGTYYVDNVRAVNEALQPAPFLVDTDFEASTDSADLRADSAWQDWYESRGDDSSLLKLNMSNVGGNDTQKAEFTASLTGNAYLTQEFGTPPTGTFTVQWKIFVDSILDDADRDRSAFMLIGDDSVNTGSDAGKGPNSTGDERFVFMAFYSPGGGDSGNTLSLIALEQGGTYNDSSTWTEIASGLSFDTWHTITVTGDLNADTYDVTINNDASPAATVDAVTPKTSVTHISFAQWNDGAGSFFVDDVRDPSACKSDLDEDGDRDGSDLAMLIDGFGTIYNEDDLADFAGVFGTLCP